jgi:putative transposase
MARPKSIPIHDTLIKLFPAAMLRDLARDAGAVVRRRKIDPVNLFWAVVLGFGVGRERTLAGLRRVYQKTSGQTVEESSFYDRFTAGFARMLREAVGRALQTLTEGSRSLQGPLSAFRALVMTDSSVLALRDLLAGTFPACRTNCTKAALKMHAVLTVGGAGRQSIRLTGQRVSDGPVFKVGPWIRGHLLLFDLGYFRYQLFACITRNRGYFVSRLKANANPRIVALKRKHRGRAVPVVGERLRDVIDRMQREVLDVTVEVEFPRRRYGGRVRRDTQQLRVVGLRDSDTDEYHLYITNVPVEMLAAEDIQAVYAARWQVELLFKELKSHYRLDDLPSAKKHVVEALVYAAILTLLVSRRLLQAIRKKLGDLADRVPEQRWAALFASVAQELLLLAVRPPRETKLIARLVSAMLLEEATDPHRDRLSLLRSIETGRHAYRLRTA